MKYKLSVVIPTYKKHHKHLQRAINSINMFEAEIVIVNNDPEYPIENDGTLNVINLKDYVEVGKARNIGVDNAKSDLIVYLDSDDLFIPNALKKMYNCYVKNLAQMGKQCIVYGDLIRGNTNTLWEFKPQYRGKNIKESDLFKPNIPYCLLIPKEWHYKIGGYNETMPTWEDLEYVSKFWCYGLKAEHCGSVVFYYNYTNHGRLSLSENKEIRETAQKIMYSSLIDYYEGRKETKFMCNTCNKTKKQPKAKSVTSLDKKIQMELKGIEDDEVAYLRYIGGQPTFNTSGRDSSGRMINYRFQANKTHNRKKIVNYEGFDPLHEIHIDHISHLLKTRLKNYGYIFKFEKEIILPSNPLKEIVIIPDVVSFSIPRINKYIEDNHVSKSQIEIWLKEEKNAVKSRKGMIKLLESML